MPGPSTQLAPVPLAIDPGSYLLDWCRFLFDADPSRVRAVEAQVRPAASPEGSGPDYLGLTLDFPGGGLAQVGIGRFDRSAWGEASRFLPAPGFQVFAERGAAWVELPDRVQWSDAQGVHDERLPAEPAVGESLNDHFYRAVRGEVPGSPTLDDALAIVRLDRDLRLSLRDARAGA